MLDCFSKTNDVVVSLFVKQSSDLSAGCSGPVLPTARGRFQCLSRMLHMFDQIFTMRVSFKFNNCLFVSRQCHTFALRSESKQDCCRVPYRWVSQTLVFDIEGSVECCPSLHLDASAQCVVRQFWHSMQRQQTRHVQDIFFL